MRHTVRALADHGGGLALALSCLLALGALAVVLSRSPLHRQRIAELTLVSVPVAVALLALPLPRPGWTWLPRPAPEQRIEVPPTQPAQRPADVALPVASSPLAVEPTPAAARMELATPPATTTAAPEASRSSAAFLAALFLLGALGFAAHLALSSILLLRLLRRATPAPLWVRQLTPLVGTRVLVSVGTQRPFCCGLSRPTIVLPERLVAPELRLRLQAILLHERAHLEQRHPRARVIAALLAPLLYWHPLYWWLVHELRRTAELVADDIAAGAMDKRRYVTELVALAESSRRGLLPSPAVVAALGSRQDFLERMETLLMRRHRLPTRTSRSHVAARTLGALFVLSSVTLAWGRQDPGPAPTVNPAAAPSAWADPVVANVRGSWSARKQASHELEAEFYFDGPHALGEFLIQSYARGLWVEIRELQTDGTKQGRVRARVSSLEPDAAQRFLADAEGLALVSIRPVQAPRATPSKRPHAASAPTEAWDARFSSLQQQVADLAQQVARLSATSSPRAQPGFTPGDPYAPPIRGKIMHSDKRGPYVIDRGTNDGVYPGMSFDVYRGDVYKGRVRVRDAESDRCYGQLEVEVEPIESGDDASTEL